MLMLSLMRQVIPGQEISLQTLHGPISGLMKVTFDLKALTLGWTVFLERKILGRMHGNEFAEFSAILGWKALKNSVDQFGQDKDGFTQLVPKLDGKDPDDAFSSIPYVRPVQCHI